MIKIFSKSFFASKKCGNIWLTGIRNKDDELGGSEPKILKLNNEQEPPSKSNGYVTNGKINCIGYPSYSDLVQITASKSEVSNHFSCIFMWIWNFLYKCIGFFLFLNFF